MKFLQLKYTLYTDREKAVMKNLEHILFSDSNPVSRKRFLHRCTACIAGLSTLKYLDSPLRLNARDNLHKAEYWEPLKNRITRCLLCPNECTLSPGENGMCNARGNRDGVLYSLVYNRPSIIALDYIDKSPLYHYQVKGKVFSIATAGCNLSCMYCHNWKYSQRGPDEVERIFYLEPRDVIKRAKKHRVKGINFFYTEPTVYFEYMKDIAILAKKEGIKTFCITAGYINEQPLKDIIPLIDAFVVGLKGFDNKFYQKYIGGNLEPVKRTLRILAENKKNTWFEIVNLLVPGLNDSSSKLSEMTKWIAAEIGQNVPVHFTRFQPNYKLLKINETPVSTLERAYSIAEREGLKHVYIGNIAGHKSGNTYCPKCGKQVIERLHFKIIKNLLKKGKCSCGYKLPGNWL